MDNHPSNHSYRRILPADLPTTSSGPSGSGFSDLPPKTRYVSLACNGCRKARIKVNLEKRGRGGWTARQVVEADRAMR